MAHLIAAAPMLASGSKSLRSTTTVTAAACRWDIVSTLIDMQSSGGAQLRCARGSWGRGAASANGIYGGAGDGTRERKARLSLAGAGGAELARLGTSNI